MQDTAWIEAFLSACRLPWCGNVSSGERCENSHAVRGGTTYANPHGLHLTKRTAIVLTMGYSVLHVRRTQFCIADVTNVVQPRRTRWRDMWWGFRTARLRSETREGESVLARRPRCGSMLSSLQKIYVSLPAGGEDIS